MFGTDSADCDCDDGEVDENSRGETDEYCLGDVLAGVVDLLGDRGYEVVSPHRLLNKDSNPDLYTRQIDSNFDHSEGVAA
jgi:hypothetical protein